MVSQLTAAESPVSENTANTPIDTDNTSAADMIFLVSFIESLPVLALFAI